MIKKFIKNINEKAVLMNCFILSFILLNVNSVFANDLMNNPITQGAQKMLQDALNVIMGLSTLALPFLIAFYQFKKKFSDDEMEEKQYNKKTKAVIFAYVIIMSSSLFATVINYYFKTGTSV